MIEEIGHGRREPVGEDREHERDVDARLEPEARELDALVVRLPREHLVGRQVLRALPARDGQPVATGHERQREQGLRAHEHRALTDHGLVDERRLRIGVEGGVEARVVFAGLRERAARHQTTGAPHAGDDRARRARSASRTGRAERERLPHAEGRDQRHQGPDRERSRQGIAADRPGDHRRASRSHTSRTTGTTTRYGSTRAATSARMTEPPRPTGP